MDTVTPKQRFMSALKGKRIDRPCAGSITSVASFELMERVGAPFPAANTEPEVMAALAAATI